MMLLGSPSSPNMLAAAVIGPCSFMVVVSALVGKAIPRAVPARLIAVVSALVARAVPRAVLTNAAGNTDV